MQHIDWDNPTPDMICQMYELAITRVQQKEKAMLDVIYIQDKKVPSELKEIIRRFLDDDISTVEAVQLLQKERDFNAS